MKTIDYNEFDKIDVFVKKRRVNEITKYYESFGWVVYEAEDNSKYEDIEDLTFIRPHNIKNKDELQLLQVHMDEKLNELGRHERLKHSRTVTLGLCLGVFALIQLIFGALMVSRVLTFINSFTLGVVLIISGTLFLIISGILLPKLFKKESSGYNTKQEGINEDIEKIIERVKVLREASSAKE